MPTQNNIPVKIGVKPYPCYGCPGLSFNEFSFEDGGVFRLPYCANFDGCPDGHEDEETYG